MSIMDKVLEAVKGRAQKYSIDLTGEKHIYEDSWRAGFKDAHKSIMDEIYFIETRNSGGGEQFWRLLKEYLQSQDLDRIIPPGHFGIASRSK